MRIASNENRAGSGSLERWIAAVRTSFLLALALPSIVSGAGGGVPPEDHWIPTASSLAEPSRSAERFAVVPLARLAPARTAEPEQLRRLREHNATRLPLQNGFVRSLPTWSVRLDRDSASAGPNESRSGGLVEDDGERTVWSASVVVEEAHAIRIGVHRLRLPPGSSLWTYARNGAARGPFGREIVAPDNAAWLPEVEGEEAFVELHVPTSALAGGATAELELDGVIEIIDLEASMPAAWTDCDIDATCIDAAQFAPIETLRRAAAHLSFVVGDGNYICSGGLVADDDATTIVPYLLTAHHCFDSQASASSLTAYFDYRSSACNGPPPGLGGLPAVSGSTLLATGPGSDFTFVQLSSTPGGARSFLGWHTGPRPPAETLHRVSHPQGTAQKYTREVVDTSTAACNGLPRPGFLYGDATAGSTTGGSSGSPIVNAAGQIVGQLYGTCGYGFDCDYGSYHLVDGAFAATAPALADWLHAPTVPVAEIETLFDAREPAFEGILGLRRSGSLAEPLDVLVSDHYCGWVDPMCAWPGFDYETLTGTSGSWLRIPAGLAGAIFRVTPIDDDLIEEQPEELVRVCISEGPGYRVGAAHCALVAIEDEDRPKCTDDAFEEDDVPPVTNVIEVGTSHHHRHCDRDSVSFGNNRFSEYEIRTSNLSGGADTVLWLTFQDGDLADPPREDDDSGLEPWSSRIVRQFPTEGGVQIYVSEYAEDYPIDAAYTVTVVCVEGCREFYSLIYRDDFEGGGYRSWSDYEPKLWGGEAAHGLK